MKQMTSITVAMFIMAVIIISMQALRYFIKSRRHDLRSKIRERYVIKNPKQLFCWSETLSLVEIKRFNKLLNGKYLVEELDGILDFRQ